jgi:hypothetical protein
MDAEISRRISSAAHSFHTVRSHIWTSASLHPDTKLQLYNSLVLSILLYGCEAWTITEEQQRRLEVFHNRCMRTIKGFTLLDHISTPDLHTHPPKSQPIQSHLVKHQLRWVGHLARKPNTYLPRQMLFAHFISPKPNRPPGRPPDSYNHRIQTLVTSDPFKAAANTNLLLTYQRLHPDIDLPRTANSDWPKLAAHRDLWGTIVKGVMGSNV